MTCLEIEVDDADGDTGPRTPRRWRVKEKLAIVSSVGVDGATVTEVSLRHDVSRQQIYMWRSELKRKGLLPPSPEPLFLPVDMTDAPLGSEANSSVDASSSMVELHLRCGRRLCFGSQVVNALRGVLYEFGYCVPQGIGHFKRIKTILDEPNSDLPALVREECQDMLTQIAEISARIDTHTKTVKCLAEETDKARRLQTMPGIGPITALAVEAFAPEMANFRRGRDFAAWLELVPRQHSSGGKERYGRVSKAGQADIRNLLIIGAMSRLNWLGRRSVPEGSWLARMMARKPRMLVAIALANRMARQIWAMLTKNEDYRDSAQAAAV